LKPLDRRRWYTPGEMPENHPATEQEVRDLKRRVSMELLQRPGVVAVGVVRVGPGAYRLAVYVDSEDTRDSLPASIQGHEVSYVVSGPASLQAFG
jgi:hypothetical protein